MPAPTSATIGSTPRPLRWWTPVLAGLGYSLCVYLAFPPAGVWPFTLLSAAVVAWLGCRATVRRARNAVLFALGAAPLWAAEEAWIIDVTGAGYPLLVMYLSFWSGLVVYAVAAIRRAGWMLPMAVAFPLAWLAVEVLRGEFAFTGFAWFLLAHPLINLPVLAAPAALLGTYFVSFLGAALVGSLADAAGWSGVPRRLGGVGAVCVCAVWAGCALLGAAPQKARGTLRIGVVQTNVPQSNKMAGTRDQIARDFERFLRLTDALAKAQPRPDLIVWPETMFPGRGLDPRAAEAFEAVFHANNPQYGAGEESLNGAMVRVLLEHQRAAGVPFFIGSDEYDGPRMARGADGRAEYEYDAKHNSVVVIADGRVQPERYDKIELMPFGEMIPYVWRWPALQRLILAVGAAGMKFDLAAGARARPLPIPGAANQGAGTVVAATPICFEVTRSSLCRRLVNAGRAPVLINLSNDGWFGDIRLSPVPSDAGREQHLLASRWRCVELGVPMVRAVNTGISAAVDPRGRVMPVRIVEGLERPTRTDGALIASVDLPAGSTLFRTVGNTFAWAAMAVGWGLVVCSWLRIRRGRTRGLEAR